MDIRSIRIFALRMLAMTLALLMIASVALAAGAVVIKQQPEDAYTSAGGSVTFSARAANDTGITWRLVSPDGSTVFLVKDVASHFPGVTFSGRNTDNLTLKNIPAEMDGWQVYCTYGGTNRVKTNFAAIHITDSQQEPDSSDDVEEPDDIDDSEGGASSFTYTGTEALTVRVVGATLTVDGSERSGSVDFSNAGKIDFKVAAPERPEYWVINGARYDFESVPRTITVRELTYPMTIEAVRKGGKAQTLLSDSQLEQKRTGETLLATTKNAEMCHINENKYGAGGWFTSFDFTDDFENRATNRKEKGGRVTLRVRPFIPKGKVISYWKFNEAKLIFGSNVTQFFVFDLNESMLYQPVFKDAAPTATPKPTAAPTATPKPTAAPTATPEPMYTVTANGCYFTFMRDSKRVRSTKNKVPAGTAIKVYPNAGEWDDSSIGYWNGTGCSVPGGATDGDPIIVTINSNATITWKWYQVVN